MRRFASSRKIILLERSAHRYGIVKTGKARYYKVLWPNFKMLARKLGIAMTQFRHNQKNIAM